MVATVDISRVYLNEDGPSVITCRHCDVQHPMHMSQYLHESIGKELVQIKCKNSLPDTFITHFDIDI